MAVGIPARGGFVRLYADHSTSRSNTTSRTGSVGPERSRDQKPRAQVKEKAAEDGIAAFGDGPANPPPTTRPPVLSLPTRGDASRVAYLWKLGQTYGRFYKDGLKAVVSNYRLAGKTRKDLEQGMGRRYRSTGELLQEAITQGRVTRAEYQLLKRNGRDMGRLPLFGVLVLLLGEWLPLVVAFIPNTVPGTCIIPSQIESMRRKAEERRRFVFRQGIKEPAREQLDGTLTDATETEGKVWSLAERQYSRRLVASLREDQLWHLSCTLNLHGRMWERLQLPPPAFLLRRRVAGRLQYMAQDDMLLTQAEGGSSLVPTEVVLACEERGLDVLGKKEGELRPLLNHWLRRQSGDRGRGAAVMEMLFRR